MRTKAPVDAMRRVSMHGTMRTAECPSADATLPHNAPQSGDVWLVDDTHSHT